MNRLVIIGNGFDLAHGLPTSYKDFIDDYWKCIIDSNHNDDFISFGNIGPNFKFNEFKNLEELGKFIMQYDEKIKFSDAEIYREYGNNYQNGKYPRAHILNYKNSFFRLINQKSIQNWVDIENEYYKELKKTVHLKPVNVLVDQDEFEILRKDKIIKLNTEFEQVKIFLEKYLIEKIEQLYDFRLYTHNPIKDILLPELSYPFDEEQYLKEFQYGDQLYIKEFLQKSKEKYNVTTHFLSFNYTKVVEKYYTGFAYTKQINYIHGKLSDSTNKINFGFGDEMDDDYKMIENIDDNEYLKNFKSFQYLQNSNYKNLLDFVESDKKFQVYIMGHSCGLSDRTMLHTIFEHPNCISIKVFYHQREDGTDNYTEIIQNISRHFNKKKLMREKIVNKTLCQPLPQIKLPLK
jgi:hypothetical protein